MRITTVTSKSGKTIYRGGIELSAGTTIKAQSKKWAKKITKRLAEDFFTISYIKIKRSYHLLIDSQVYGRMTRTDVQTLKTFIKDNSHEYTNFFQNNSTFQQQQLSLHSNRESVRNQKRDNDGILCVTPQRIQSESYETRSDEHIPQTALSTRVQPTIEQRLEAVHQELVRDEQSECSTTRKIAQIRRDQLEIALEQREIALDQQRIKSGIEILRGDQQQLAEGIEDLAGGIKNLTRTCKNVAKRCLADGGIIESSQSYIGEHADLKNQIRSNLLALASL